jgi:hypothetical protein
MAHRTSPAALHAARVILRQYDITVRPADQLVSGAIHNLRADEAHLSILIDMTSNAFRVGAMRPELGYWQSRLYDRTATAPQIGNFIRKLIEALESVPQAANAEDVAGLDRFLSQLPVGVVGRPSQCMISRASTEAARYCLHYYDFRAKKPAAFTDGAHERMEIAKLIEISLGLRHALKALPLLRLVEPQFRDGKLTEAEIARCFREVGVHLEMMPNYEDRREQSKLLLAA